jgi:hypothetical protein
MRGGEMASRDGFKIGVTASVQLDMARGQDYSACYDARLHGLA